MKIYYYEAGHMTKIAAMFIGGETPLKLCFSIYGCPFQQNLICSFLDSSLWC